MEDDDRNLLREVAKASLRLAYDACGKQNAGEAETVTLTEEETARLAGKIAALPVEYQSILFLHGCFHLSSPQIEMILGIGQVGGKLAYIGEMLSVFMGFSHGLADVSMEDACREALDEYLAAEQNVGGLRPKYSHEFRRLLKKIPAAQKTERKSVFLAKRAAVVLLAAAIGFSSALAVNAEWRERFYDWVVETFPDHTRFRMEKVGDDEVDAVDLEDFEIGYVPEGFELSEKTVMRTMVVYSYHNAEGKDITIVLSKHSAVASHNTENADVTELNFKGNIAYLWNRETLTYMVWTQDSIQCNVSGYVDRKEILKIAQKISK